MATVTRGTLRSRAKSLVDKANDSFVTDSEWNDFLNEGADELHGLLARAWEQYVASEASFVTDGTENVTLPSDFFKLTGVDFQWNGRWGNLYPFDWADRNALRNFTGGGAPPNYCLRGSKLKLLPVPAAGLSGKFQYVPVRTPMANDTDVFDGINGWEAYVCVHAAIRAMQKGEEDATPLLAEKARLEARIRTEASNRNGAQPARVRDTEYEARELETFSWRAFK